MAESAEECAKYEELLAEGLRYASRAAFREAMDWRRAARALCEAIALRPDEPMAYFNLGSVLSSSGHEVESAQRFLEAKARFPEGSEPWAKATASAFDVLQHGQSAVLAVPQLGSCASSGRAWRLWAARHSQEEAGPLGARPLPSVLEPAASEAAQLTAFDHVGSPQKPVLPTLTLHWATEWHHSRSFEINN